MADLNSIAVEFDLVGMTSKVIPIEEIRIDPTDANKIYWIHCDLNQEALFGEIAGKLALSDKFIQLCLNEDTSKKIIDTGDNLTIQSCDIISGRYNGKYEVKFGHLILHLSKQLCLTASRDQLPALMTFQQEYQKNIKYATSPGFIFFLILDNVINDYSAILQEYELIADNLDTVIREVHKGTYGEGIEIKSQVMKIKRNAASLRDVLMRISGRKISVITEPCRLSLCGLFDHAQMIVNETDALRDVLNSDLDFIGNSLIQKINGSIKIITILSAIFLPLSVLTRIYISNFHWIPIPDVEWNHSFYFAIVFIFLCVAGLLFWFRRMKWI